MGCGCGGSTGGSGGCGGGARPEIEVPVDAPLFEELPHEEDSEPAAEQASGEPLLIASSEQEWPRVRVNGVAIASQRSEEHTSELQSLMRISYAVFCLKKKN